MIYLLFFIIIIMIYNNLVLLIRDNEFVCRSEVYIYRIKILLYDIDDDFKDVKL